MGLRSNLRRRAGQVLRDVAFRLIGDSNTDGIGESHGERTSAWPPSTMGAPDGDPPTHLHPADRAAMGLPAVNFAGGRWDKAHPAATPPVAESTPEVTVDVSPVVDLTVPLGSVGQPEFLPPPRKSAPAPAPEPPVDGHSNGHAHPDAGEGVVARPITESIQARKASGPPPEEGEKGEIKAKVIEALKTIFDPEIPVDIYELGLIYDVDIQDDRSVEIKMTLTSPNCPAAQSLPAEVELKSAAVDGVSMAMVDIVWEPPWGPEHMSEAAKLELNIDL